MIKIPPSSEETFVIQHEGKIYHAQPINSVVVNNSRHSSGGIVKLNNLQNNMNAKRVILMDKPKERILKVPRIDNKNVNDVVKTVVNKVSNNIVNKVSNNVVNKVSNNVVNKGAKIMVKPNINSTANNIAKIPINNIAKNPINKVINSAINKHAARPIANKIQQVSGVINNVVSSSGEYNRQESSPEKTPAKESILDNSKNNDIVINNATSDNSVTNNVKNEDNSTSSTNSLNHSPRCMDKSGNILANARISDMGKNNIIGDCCDKIHINGDKNNIGHECYNIYTEGDYHQVDKNVKNCWIRGTNMHIKQNCGNSILEGSHGLSVNVGESVYAVPMTKMGVTKVGKAQETKIMLIARVDKMSAACLYNSLCMVCNYNYFIYLPHHDTVSLVTMKFIARIVQTTNESTLLYATGTATNTVITNNDGNSKWEKDFFVISFDTNKFEKELLIRGVNRANHVNSVSIEVVNNNAYEIEVISTVNLMALSG